MRAVVLHEYGGPEKLKFEDNVSEPQASGNAVLIAAAAASVNPIEWKLRSGTMQKMFPLIDDSGYSGSGCERHRADIGTPAKNPPVRLRTITHDNAAKRK